MMTEHSPFKTEYSRFRTEHSIQDRILSIQDRILSVQDRTLSIQDRILSIQDRILSIQDRILSNITQNYTQHHNDKCREWMKSKSKFLFQEERSHKHQAICCIYAKDMEILTKYFTRRAKRFHFKMQHNVYEHHCTRQIITYVYIYISSSSINDIKNTFLAKKLAPLPFGH